MRVSVLLTLATMAAASAVATPPVAAAAAHSCSAPGAIHATADGQVLNGTPGPDVLDANFAENVTFNGLAGDDTICGAFGSVIDAGPGDDYIVDRMGNASVDAGPGNDLIDLYDGNADVHGGPGNDTLALGSNDLCPTAPECAGTRAFGFYGEDGNDVVRIHSPIDEGGDPSGAPFHLDFADGKGRDGVDLSGVGFGVLADLGAHHATWFGYGGVSLTWSHIEWFRGSRRADTISGSASADRIYGDRGRDTIRGRRGSDGLFGGRGNDRIRGDRGHDTAHGGPGHDRCSAERRFSC